MNPTALLAALDLVVFEQRHDGRFVAQGDIPDWCRRVCPGVDWHAPVVIEELFPFLGVFLPEAERAWENDQHARAESDLWAMTDATGGDDVHLLATALQVERVRALLVIRSERLYLGTQTLLQRARELRLVHGSLMREIEQKDILVHTIVHDLVAPLHSILGVLSLLDERAHEEPETGWVRLGVQAAMRQRDLIGEILEAFAADTRAFGQEEVAGADLAETIERVLAEREPVARTRNVKLERVSPLAGGEVVSDPMRLFRVVVNLIDNAMRFTPAGGAVRVRTTADDASVTLLVEDEGPGVPPEVLPRLFQKFARGADRGGTGLGLYFCRIAVESWGGSIGYQPCDGGGASFWVRLKRKTRHRASTTDEPKESRWRSS